MDSDSLEDPTLARRRQAARLAQRAFRQRQIDTIERLENELAALKSATEDISKVSMNLGHAELDQAVDRALQVAGLELGKGLGSVQSDSNNSIVSSSDPLRIHANSHSEPSDSFVAAQKTVPIEAQPSLQLAKRFSPTMDPAATVSNPWFPKPTVPVQEKDVSWQDLPDLQERGYQAGRMSPRLTYGLWFEPDRFIQLNHAPADIMPYLGDGEHTFAGALYWGTAELGCWILNQYQKRQLVSDTRSLWNSTALVQAIFGICFGLEQPETLIRCIKVKLELRKYGRMDMYDHDAALRLRHLVLQEVARRGDAMCNYLSALQVAQYIRQRCVLGTVEELDIVARNQDDWVSRSFMAGLVKKLALKCVLFGDGPRYRVEAVDEAVRTSLPKLVTRLGQNGI